VTTVGALFAEGADPSEVSFRNESGDYANSAWSGPFAIVPRQRPVGINEAQYATNALSVGIAVDINPQNGLTIVGAAIITDGRQSVRAVDR
jgi:hypothetical protein